MKEIILEIRNRIGVSQEDLAKMIGTSFATINRWENGHSYPNKALQLRLYEVCKEKEVNLEEMILNKINRAAEDIPLHQGKKILYHGSKAGIEGPISPISRERCDFGRGFYMGKDPRQPLTMISDFNQSKYYIISLDIRTLNILEISPGLEWAMLVAFHRGKMEGIKESKLYESYAGKIKGYDVVTGNIANDRMFYVLDNFFLGNITDKALVKSLSALNLGKQYVAVSKKACKQVKIEKEIELSYLERIYLRELSEQNRVKGINLANEICRDYRREGLFFDEILKKYSEGGDDLGQYST